MSSFVIKWIAVITMLIDHIGVTLIAGGTPLYYVCRAVGRVAFPLFAFMLAEGFFYTKDARRYILRLCIFAVISEIPFDLMLTGVPVYWGQQNVFVTLALALTALYMFDEFARRDSRFPALMTLLAAAAAAVLTRSDYGAFGILMVFVFYRFRGDRRGLVIWYSAAVILFTSSAVLSAIPGTSGMIFAFLTLFELFSIVPVLCCNRRKGYSAKGWQFFFYAFYPAHMLALWLLRGYLTG